MTETISEQEQLVEARMRLIAGMMLAIDATKAEGNEDLSDMMEGQVGLIKATAFQWATA